MTANDKGLLGALFVLLCLLPVVKQNPECFTESIGQIGKKIGLDHAATLVLARWHSIMSGYFFVTR